MAIEAAPSEIENKLIAARTRLILDRPFLGALVLRLPLREAAPSWCAATHTDAKTLFYNPAYVDALSFEQVQFVLAADALHCALSHFNRRGHRELTRWQLACAYAVNQILVDEGMTPPPAAPLSDAFHGMTAEEIYHLLDDDGSSGQAPENDRADPSPPSSGAAAEAGAASAPPPLSQTEKDVLQQQWQQRLAGAAQQALQAGKLGPGMARLIELFLQPTLPWRAVLARYLNSISRNDYSYARPSSRRGDPAIYPSLRSAHVDLVVAVDVSGSIDVDELNEFMAEIDALKAQVQARVTLLTCDSALTDDCPWIFEAWETCALPQQIAGGGGTDFAPAFEWVAARDVRPDLLIYFTDAEGRFPDCEPEYPTLWLVKGHSDVPWGQRIQLN